MSKIKSVSQFEDNIWGEATPIGADASNIDVEMSDSSTKDLQTVLGDIPSAAAPIQSQINTKVTASGGNIGNTTVSSGIQNFDSSSSETSTELLDTSVRVTNATEVTSSMWTKFNRFRKRVDNKFKDVFLSSVEDVASPSLTKTYSQSALNDYFANVVGYATAADLPDASSTIASQLSTLNNNIFRYSLVGCRANGTIPNFPATTISNTATWTSLSYYDTELAPTLFELNSANNGIVLKESYDNSRSYFIWWSITGHMTNTTGGTPAAGLKGWNTVNQSWEEIYFSGETLTASQYRAFTGFYVGWYGGSVNSITTLSLGGRNNVYVSTGAMLAIFAVHAKPI